MKKIFFILAVTLSCWTINARVQGNSQNKTSLFNEKWLDAIISIETIDQKGDLQPKGTGFLIQTESNYTVLVTVSHVIKNDLGNLYENLQYRRSDIDGDNAIITDKVLSSSLGDWFFSESYDLTCRFFGWPLEKKRLTTIPLQYILEVEKLQPGAPLLVLGFPTGLRSNFYKKPVVRRGIVARADDGKIIIETFVFPGNSGGPVVYVPLLKLGRGLTSPLVNEEMLVGVITSYIPYREAAISPQTGRTRIVFEENSGLSDVIPAKAIKNLISRKDVKELEKTLNLY